MLIRKTETEAGRLFGSWVEDRLRPIIGLSDANCGNGKAGNELVIRLQS